MTLILYKYEFCLRGQVRPENRNRISCKNNTFHKSILKSEDGHYVFIDQKFYHLYEVGMGGCVKNRPLKRRSSVWNKEEKKKSWLGSLSKGIVSEYLKPRETLKPSKRRLNLAFYNVSIIFLNPRRGAQGVVHIISIVPLCTGLSMTRTLTRLKRPYSKCFKWVLENFTRM